MADIITNIDMNSFFNGHMNNAYRFFGSRKSGRTTRFSVYAPGADRSFVKFCDKLIPMTGQSGIWSCETTEDVSAYRYVFEKDGCVYEKNDPFAFSVKNQVSEVYDISGINVGRPEKSYDYMNIYELHIGSWQENDNFASVADSLGQYL